MIEVGMTYTAEKTVTPDMTAKAVGSGGLEVFGTPFMMGLMENAAMQPMRSSCRSAPVTDGIFTFSFSAISLVCAWPSTAISSAIASR